MKHYKAIVLFLASEDLIDPRFSKRLTIEDLPLYPFFKKICEHYMNQYDDIKFLFVYGDKTTFEPKEYDLIYNDVTETILHPAMLVKTLKAINYIDKNFSYDYLIRTNLSTFWDLHKLRIRLDHLPKEKCLAGTHVRFSSKGCDYHTIAGFDLVASRDLIKSIIGYEEEMIRWPSPMGQEDVTICEFMKKYGQANIIDEQIVKQVDDGSTLILRNDMVIPSLIKGPRDTSVDHYRCKNVPQRHRIIDKVIHIRLLKEIYNINVDNQTIDLL
jgi:hypothetical protein